MQPTTPRDFLKVALQRLTAAEKIMDILRLTVEAQYSGGYSVECSLKALILEKTAEVDRPAVLDLLTHGATYHRAEVLLDRLKSSLLRGCADSTGRPICDRRRVQDTGETNGLLRTARAIYEWVEGQIS